MNMFVGAILIMLSVVNIGALFYLFLTFKKLALSVDKIHLRIDSLFTMDAPSENPATKEDPNLVDLGENPILPENVKLEVEGGQTQVPPDFTETK